MATLILIVEDEPNNMKLVRDLLQISGYESIEATDGEQGVRLAEEYKPDLILMDIHMTGMDGLDVSRILKANASTRNIPIIALTSRAMYGDREEILRAGCDDYLSKPIDIQEFRDKVNGYFATQGDKERVEIS